MHNKVIQMKDSGVREFRWELDSSEGNPLDPHGVGGLLARLERDIAAPGEKLSGFRFLNDARDMLRYTREIERDVARSSQPGSLYVGFQTAEKAEAESSRYSRMRDLGVAVTAFGEGLPSDEAVGAFRAWRQLEGNRHRVENQWFLIAEQPSPIAFVGWEVSPDELWGKGGATTEGKQFVGFVSDDLRVVRALTSHLDNVKGVQPGGGPGTTKLADLLRTLKPRRSLTLVDDGKRPYLPALLTETQAACRAVGCRLFLYDLSAASYLVNPYPSPGPEWRRPLDAGSLRQLGRVKLAELVERAVGIDAYGILPDDVGFDHLAKWCRDNQIEVAILPVELTRPTLLERLQGLTINHLRESADVTVVIFGPDSGSHVVVRSGAAGMPVR